MLRRLGHGETTARQEAAAVPQACRALAGASKPVNAGQPEWKFDNYSQGSAGLQAAANSAYCFAWMRQLKKVVGWLVLQPDI